MKKTSGFQKKPMFALIVLVLAQFAVHAQTPAANVASQTINSNVALGKTATASTADNSNYAASFAIDGNLQTRFASGSSDNQWLSVDMGKAYLISQVIITWHLAYGKDFDILFSNNGSFTDLYIDSIQVRNRVLNGNGVVAGNDTLRTKTSTVARYMRIQVIHSAAGKGFSIWEMQVLGATSATGLFPVSVTGFTATAQNNASLLEWMTVTEYSNAGFSIERSNDAVNFITVGTVAARNAGTVTTHYAFTDKKAPGGKNYYRLKQTWVDGKIGYSAVIAVSITGNSSVNIYPVPVKDRITVDYKGTAGENISIAIFNSFGLPVYNSKVSVQTGQQTVQINRTSNMTAGQYFIHISSSDNKKFIEKIVLQ